jgi:spore coat polysaccharide biosynthesis predicted glycosyltransferase SpsG
VPAVRLVATAGSFQGHGHLARALSLAEARWKAGTVLELELVDGTLSDGERGRAEAVGVRQVAGGDRPTAGTLVVVDVPEPGSVAARFDPMWLAVFDDRDAFDGRAAIIVQPSQEVWRGTGEARWVLAGYDYFPISAAVRRRGSTALGAPAEPARGHARRPRVVVCFGGSDPSDVTGRLVPALMSLDADLEVVVGPSYRGATDGWSAPVRRDPPDLVERLATADLALLGAGTMKFEAACLARPMVLLAVADDQPPVGSTFAATGAARYLGDGRTIDPTDVVDAVAALLADPHARTELGSAAARVIDGGGADRVAAAIERLGQPAARS